MATEETWKQTPEDHDFPAASDYLSLVLDAATVTAVIAELRKASPITRKAKDLLRASRLPELPPENVHVAADLRKVETGQRLSPVLVVRGRLDDDVPLTIADGYHRVCASYHLDEDADIPCFMAELPRR